MRSGRGVTQQIEPRLSHYQGSLGASETGNIALQVPTDSVGEGVLSFIPGFFGSPVYVAVQ